MKKKINFNNFFEKKIRESSFTVFKNSIKKEDNFEISFKDFIALTIYLLPLYLLQLASVNLIWVFNYIIRHYERLADMERESRFFKTMHSYIEKPRKDVFFNISNISNFDYMPYTLNSSLKYLNSFNLYLLNFLKIIGFFSLALALALILTTLANVLSRTTRSRKTRSKQIPDFEKNSAYECGFEPFEDARNSFDVNFYLVALLFILFDLEIVFLFPWCLFSYFCNGFEYSILIIFIYILTLGFVYEWKKGALEWY